jgi:hypothetical protein
MKNFLAISEEKSIDFIAGGSACRQEYNTLVEISRVRKNKDQRSDLKFQISESQA